MIRTRVLLTILVSALAATSTWGQIITSATVNYSNNTLIILGTGFGPTAQITLGQARVPLAVLRVTLAPPQTVIAAFPSTTPASSFAPGTYLLTVVFPGLSTASFEVAMGASESSVLTLQREVTDLRSAVAALQTSNSQLQGAVTVLQPRNTIVVHPVPGNPRAAGNALLQAMAGINTAVNAASAANPWLIKLEPGVFDLGTASLVMQPYVGIEGSGEGVTKITAASGPGTVTGANNAELRLLTIDSTIGYQGTAVFVPVGTSPRLTHVTLTSAAGGIGLNSSGGESGLSSSGLILTDVTVNLSAGGTGIQLSGGELLRRVTVTVGPAPGAISIGLFIVQGYPQAIPITIVDSTIVAGGQGVFDGGGIENFTIDRSTIMGGIFAIELLGEGPPATVRVGTSQLIGQVGPTFELTCFGDYNGSYAPMDAKCQ